MNLQQIKEAVDAGKTVYWSNSGYRVVKGRGGDYLIQHRSGSCGGLTWKDGVTLNGDESDFFTKGDEA